MAPKRKSCSDITASPGSYKKIRSGDKSQANVIFDAKPDQSSRKSRQEWRQKPMVDSTYGQVGAIPGLDGDWEDDGDEDDGTKAALQYLRTVR